MKKAVLALALLLSLVVDATAQTTSTSRDNSFKLGDKFYLYWGWNRSRYTKSDIRLYGTDHDFTMTDVKAKDLQTDFSLKEYFFITRLSIPQTNLKAGYFLNEKYSIAAGFDHMKYKVVNGQSVNIDGRIDRVSAYKGEYHDTSIVISEDFLHFDHTDGLNYVFGEINRHDQWLNLARGKVRISSETGVGLAILRPRTAVTFLNEKGPNVYHFAGYGVNGKVGLNFLLFRHISLMTEVKGGVINMPNIRATANKDGKAKQHFGFIQANCLIGATFGIR